MNYILFIILILSLILIINAYNSTTSLEEESNESNNTLNNNNNDSDNDIFNWEKNQRIQAQQEIRRKRKQKDKEKENLLIAKRTLEAASSEECDWKSQPLALLRGEVCGSFYKILGLDRKRGIIDKSDIKKAYRSKSLSVHPDKNPSSEAIEAFKLVQDAYECLSDDNCRRSYDRQLSETEERIATFREELKKQFIDKALNAVTHVHYYISVTAHHIYQTGLDLWDLAGELEVNFLGQPRPVGKALLALSLVFKGKTLLAVHALSYFIVRLNYELAKSRGLL
mmetsp:Transcript_12952/g.11732  ORF Transcript_12952/g.11732 Transcript_12952/m.11732 type:complete len:282 (+) Transcript_12952:57-902(+)